MGRNGGHSLTSSFTKLMSFFSSRSLLEYIKEPAFGFPAPKSDLLSYQGSAFPHLNPDKFGPWAFWESEAAPSCCFLLVGPKASAESELFFHHPREGSPGADHGCESPHLHRHKRPDPQRKLLPPHRMTQTHRHPWVLTRGQGFCPFLFFRILSNPDKDLEERREMKWREAC